MKRKRIKNRVLDPLEFKANCASENARLLYRYNEFEIELWIDKHYHIRRSVGDDSGKRDNIEEKEVKDLIIQSFKYLIDFYLRFPKFTFINFFEKGKINRKRLVLQDYKIDGILNVVIEIHFLDVSKYEITVVTAMSISDFKIADGQFVLSFSSSKIVLKKMENKILKEIYKVQN